MQRSLTGGFAAPLIILILLALAALLAFAAPAAATSVGPVTNLGYYDYGTSPRAVRFEWNAATNADTYTVSVWTRRLNSDGVWVYGWESFGSTSQTHDTITYIFPPPDPTLKYAEVSKGNEAHWKVQARSGSSVGPAVYVSGIVGSLGSPSNPRSVTKLRSPTVTSIAGFPGTVLDWKHPRKGAVYGYVVWRKENGTSTWKSMPSPTGARTTHTRYHITWGGSTTNNPNCMEEGKTYTYRIRAIGHGGTMGPASTFSNISAPSGSNCGDPVG